MATETTTNVQRTDNGKVPGGPEQTRPGPVYSPVVDIFEDDSSITVLADIVGSATLVARKTTLVEVKTVGGAVYNPVASIVPN